MLDAEAGVYAQAPQPGTIDDTLGYFVRDRRMRMPLALLMTTRLLGVLAGAVKTIDHVESTEILGVPTQHIAARTDNVDFQFWIKKGKSPLPLRVVITIGIRRGSLSSGRISQTGTWTRSCRGPRSSSCRRRVRSRFRSQYRC